jgi:acyltransferase
MPHSGYIRDVVWALLAISFVIYISQFLAVSPLLNAMGRNSLTLMALHTALSFKLFNIYFREGLLLEDHPNMLGLFLSVFTMGTLLPVSYVINKFSHSF